MTKQISIKDLGLKKYLNSTAADHDGFKYADFVKYHDERGWGPVALARLFLVTKNTMIKWIKIHKEETSKHKILQP
jgi:hypothetical protein